MKKVLDKRKDIAFFIKLFPLNIHKDSYRKAKSIQCKKSLSLLEDAFNNKEIPDPECDTDVIDKNIRLARSLDITGTPTIVLDDGRVLGGIIKAEQIIMLIKEKTRRATGK
jgi:thiol:disulfide interchange protein DsbC